MLLRTDGSIQLYGMHAWVCLFPWDPMGRDFPERVTPLLEEGFLSLWAQAGGPIDPAAAEIVLPESRVLSTEPIDGNGSRHEAATGGRSRGQGSGRSNAAAAKRRLAGAKDRAASAQRELEKVEGELETTNQRRHGLETWSALVEERLRAAKTRLDEAASTARAQEARLPEIERRLEDAENALEQAGAQAESSRRRVEAAGRSVRAARSVRRLRRVEDGLTAMKQAVEDARERERAAVEDLAGRQATLDRALSKLTEARKAEAVVQRRVTNARRKAARASLVLADLMDLAAEGTHPTEKKDDAPAQLHDAEAAQKEAQEAKAELVAAADEVRSVGEMVASAESHAQISRRALLEARAETEGREALVRGLEAAIADAEARIRELEPSLVDAEADVHRAGDRVVAAGRSIKVGRHVWKLSRARRQARASGKALEVARRELEVARSRLQEAYQAAQEAEGRVKEGRGVEAEARRGLVDARRRLGSAVGVLSRLWSAGEDHRGPEEPFQYLVIVRDRAVLGSLSLHEWAHRASGHARVPRFILEKEGEALWLYRGEWIVADPSLTLDDLAVVNEMVDLPDVSDPESVDGRARSLDLEAIQFTWERSGGRCSNCGSLANLVIDHVIPVYLGGSDSASNLQLLCRNCSREKSHQL